MNVEDLAELDGKIALVCSARDHRNPPTGVRGTIRVREVPVEGRPVVQVEMDFPQMFATRAHHRVVTLSDEELLRLRASGHDGAFTVVIDDRLDPEAPAGSE